MFYNNIIYLLVVILLFSTGSTPHAPHFPPPLGLLIFLAKAGVFWQGIRFFFARQRVRRSSNYFSAEQRGSILAILFTAIDIYLLDCQYYFALLPFSRSLPSLGNLAGVALFFSYLSLVWIAAAPRYYDVFGRYYSRLSFIFHNARINLPIILPWVLLSLLSDLLQLLPFPWLTRFLASSWGETAVLLSFFIVLSLIFPVIITRLWKCTPLPLGETRRRIETFCQQQNLHYADILSWPLFEGQVLTAGVLGLTRRFRYLLVTPALLSAMTPEEIEAVMAHEIGHVKKHHLQLYLFLFIGFGMLAQVSTYPVLSILLNSDLFHRVIDLTSREPGTALAYATTLPMLLFMVLYFRFLFGFFMRNFERQADLHVFEAMGDAKPLMTVLEKIAILSGNIRDVPSWHHFSIGQRVDFLDRCRRTTRCITTHNRKVYGALLLYLAVFCAAGFLLWRMPDDLLTDSARERFAEMVVSQKIESDPGNYVWHQFLGDLLQDRKQYAKAIESYQSALRLAPDQPEIMNNLAWLLLTTAEHSLRDPDHALLLAREAVKRKPTGYILDTLALAYWQNGFTELAIQTEKEAIEKDPANREYYQHQMNVFTGTESIID